MKNIEMNAFIVSTLKTFCCSNDMFDNSSAFERFERDRVIEGSSGLNSKIIFGRVVYKDQNNDAEYVSPPLMLKVMPRSSTSKEVVLVQFFNEIAFHTRALPILQRIGDAQLLFAKLYDSQIHLTANSSDFMLIFEDLRNQGYRTHDKHSFLDVDHLSLMLRKLGQFHAYSYYAKCTDGLDFHSLSKWFYDTMNTFEERIPNFIRKSARRGLERLRQDKRYKDKLANIEKAVDNAVEFLRRINIDERRDPMSVLCHGDYIRGNVMFRYDKNEYPVDLKMIDTATSRVASPIIDVGTILYLNADQTTRNLYWDRLLDSYYQGLCETFGRDFVGLPSKEHIVNEFNTKALYAYFVASYFLPHTIAIDRGMPDFFQCFPTKYVNCSWERIPGDILVNVCYKVGGEEGTDALADVLRDMIDRGFV